MPSTIRPRAQELEVVVPGLFCFINVFMSKNPNQLNAYCPPPITPQEAQRPSPGTNLPPPPPFLSTKKKRTPTFNHTASPLWPRVTLDSPKARLLLAALVTKPRSHGRRDFSWLNKPLARSRIRLRSVVDEQQGSREKEKEMPKKKKKLVYLIFVRGTLSPRLWNWHGLPVRKLPVRIPVHRKSNDLIYGHWRAKVTLVIHKEIHTTCKKKSKKKSQHLLSWRCRHHGAEPYRTCRSPVIASANQETSEHPGSLSPLSRYPHISPRTGTDCSSVMSASWPSCRNYEQSYAAPLFDSEAAPSPCPFYYSPASSLP